VDYDEEQEWQAKPASQELNTGNTLASRTSEPKQILVNNGRGRPWFLKRGEIVGAFLGTNGRRTAVPKRVRRGEKGEKNPSKN